MYKSIIASNAPEELRIWGLIIENKYGENQNEYIAYLYPLGQRHNRKFWFVFYSTNEENLCKMINKEIKFLKQRKVFDKYLKIYNKLCKV